MTHIVKSPNPSKVIPHADPSSYLPRIKQIQWDHYYMQVAATVEMRANCWGTAVGAVLVLHNRIISTGFNGTPEGFPNCEDGGCERCRQRELRDEGRVSEVTDPLFLGKGKHLDVCICVHAEANALLSAARFGTRTDGATLYSTYTPCFSCLKEMIQAGVRRVVYLNSWDQAESDAMRQQYQLLAQHLRGADGGYNFEQLARQGDLVKHTGGHVRAPVLDDRIPQEGIAEATESRPQKRASRSPSTSGAKAARRTGSAQKRTSRSPSAPSTKAAKRRSASSQKPPGTASAR
jgi:dCMP deaminase